VAYTFHWSIIWSTNVKALGLNLYSWLCLYFAKISFRDQAFFLKNEEISSPSPCGFLIGIYMFCEGWSTETFREKEDSEISLLIKSFVLM